MTPKQQAILTILERERQKVFPLTKICNELGETNHPNVRRSLKALVNAGRVEHITSGFRKRKGYRISHHYGHVDIEAFIQKIQRARTKMFEPRSSTLILSQAGNFYGRTDKVDQEVEVPEDLVEDTLVIKSRYDLFNISVYFDRLQNLIVSIGKDEDRPRNLRFAAMKRIYKGCRTLMDNVFEDYSSNDVGLDGPLSARVERSLEGIYEAACEIFQSHDLDFIEDRFFKVSDKEMVTYMMDLGLPRDLISGLSPPTLVLISSPEYWIQEINPITGWDILVLDEDHMDEED